MTFEEFKLYINNTENVFLQQILDLAKINSENTVAQNIKEQDIIGQMFNILKLLINLSETIEKDSAEYENLDMDVFLEISLKCISCTSTLIELKKMTDKEEKK